MKISLPLISASATGLSAPVDAISAADAYLVGIAYEDLCQGTVSDDFEHYGIDLQKLKATGFEGKTGEVQILTGSNNFGPGLVIAAGIGRFPGVTNIRTATIEAIRAGTSFKHIASYLIYAAADLDDDDFEMAIQAHAEGIVLGAYAFREYKSSQQKTELRKVSVVAPSKFAAAHRNGQRIGEAVNFARDLVNEPGGSLTPRKFAGRVQTMARQNGLSCKVWNKPAIEKAQMGGLLGVNRGSEQEPRFVQLAYTPKKASRGHLALVGKGITFDSGGLSIKPASGMMTMKYDMAGAAAVAGAMFAIASLKPSVKVSAYLPMTDNMTGGDATRPGDVLKTHSKKTVEVLNTDAEGRLILADALSIASKAKPDAVVDLATLTGACVVALGDDIAGLLGNNNGWNESIEKSAKRTDEKVWELPLVSEYRSQLDSSVADIQNIGSNYGGTITAALFLQEFVGEGIAWAHLDIAGPAFREKAEPKGATGYGVRLLADLAANFKKSELSKPPAIPASSKPASAKSAPTKKKKS